MQDMVNVYFYGKKYSVPADLTIMAAMEYAGYRLVRGCGCRHGFCGAMVKSTTAALTTAGNSKKRNNFFRRYIIWNSLWFHCRLPSQPGNCSS